MSQKVVLFLPPYNGGLIGPPLSLLSLASPLRTAGFEARIIDGALEPDYLGRIEKEIQDCLCFGVSLLTGPMIATAIAVTRHVKQLRPDLPVIFGGWHPSLLPAETLREDFVDAVVLHQGDTSKVERIKTGFSGSGLGIDSQGNVWVTNRLGSSARGKAILQDVVKTLKNGGNGDEVVVEAMGKQTNTDGGSVSLLRPDGTQYPGSPFTGGGLPGPWAVAVDGNDNIWISNFAMPNSPIVQLCGVKIENCPSGMKTGDQISPPGGYVGGGLQMQTDIGVDPGGNVWVMNNWQDMESCFGIPNEALATRCGGQGVVIFYGMAKPVRAPQIGPARRP